MGFGFPSVRVGKPNQPESDHDRPPPRAGAVDGSSYVGLNPPTAPTAVLHHYRGHQQLFGTFQRKRGGRSELLSGD